MGEDNNGSEFLQTRDEMGLKEKENSPEKTPLTWYCCDLPTIECKSLCTPRRK